VGIDLVGHLPLEAQKYPPDQKWRPQYRLRIAGYSCCKVCDNFYYAAFKTEFAAGMLKLFA
jgi:hypothetical protein